MSSSPNLDDRVPIAQMNSELQHAQLELFSADRATRQLRLRYSIDDLARFGQRDLLRKSAQTANALSEYYTAIEKKIPAAEPVAEPAAQATGDRIAGIVARMCSYLSAQRDAYASSAAPLSNQQKALMWPYFSAELLDRIRILELDGGISDPPFYEDFKALGFVDLPELRHMRSSTFLDVVVFTEPLTARSLFHALVHAVQFEVLGLDRYADLFVRSFVKTKLLVPLEAHAFSLESKFAATPTVRFSVEEQVRLWVKQGRY